MRNVIVILALAGMGLFINPVGVIAQNNGNNSMGVEVASDYKGKVSETLFYEWNTFWVKSGIYAYYKVHGDWPASWGAVKADGLIQINLISPEGFVIDPDDQSLDFYGDVYFFRETDYYGDFARLAEMKDIEGTVINYMDLQQPGTYANIFQWVIDNSELGKRPEVDSYLTELQTDPVRMKQIGIAKMLYDGIFLYKTINGHLPSDWDEYVNSGFAPITADSINPITSRVFEGNGSAGDFFYKYYPADGDQPESFEFMHIDLDGNRPLVRITY
ncbi:MAG: hypothetical protein R3F46_02145 [bacterium]